MNRAPWIAAGLVGVVLVLAWRRVQASGGVVGVVGTAARDAITAGAVTVWEYVNPELRAAEQYLTADTIIRDGRVISPVPDSVRAVQRQIQAQPAAVQLGVPGYEYLDPTAPIN